MRIVTAIMISNCSLKPSASNTPVSNADSKLNLIISKRKIQTLGVTLSLSLCLLFSASSIGAKEIKPPEDLFLLSNISLLGLIRDAGPKSSPTLFPTPQTLTTMPQPIPIKQVLTAERISRNTSSNASLLPTAKRNSPAVARLINRFGNSPAELLTLFAPNKQEKYCEKSNIEKIFFGNAPIISDVALAYGRNVAESWLEIQLNDLSEYSGCKEKLSIEQSTALAAQIINSYPKYNLAEFMLFFYKFKDGDYERFYNSVDPMIIKRSLKSFNAYRDNMRAKRLAAEERKSLDDHFNEINAIRRRYKERIPNAFEDAAPISFLQYQLMGFDSMSDDRLNQVIGEVMNGQRKLPSNTRDMYKI